jgi:dTDP-4-dehydrorhamnose reductase
VGYRPVVVVTGSLGLLGRTVLSELARRGWDARGFTHAELDIADAGAVRKAVTSARPSLVVNSAAMTNVDACESQPERAWAVNAEGAGHVAGAAADVGAEVVHVSTDYVFDGTKGGYVESDDTNPLQIYGRAKLGGEELVRGANPRHYVLRSAWIYGHGGRNFVSKIPDLVVKGDALSVVADQRSSPTFAPDLATAIAGVAGSERYGAYHVVNEGSCSYAEFARYVAELAGGSVPVADISGADIERPAARPADSSLVGARWADEGFAPLRPWREAAAQFWSDLHHARTP